MNAGMPFGLISGPAMDADSDAEWAPSEAEANALDRLCDHWGNLWLSFGWDTSASDDGVITVDIMATIGDHAAPLRQHDILACYLKATAAGWSAMVGNAVVWMDAPSLNALIAALAAAECPPERCRPTQAR